MRIYPTPIKRIACGVLMASWAAPNPAFADGTCAALTGSVATQTTFNPNWPAAEPFAWIGGTADVQIDRGRTISLTVSGEIAGVALPADDDFDSSPTGQVSASFDLADVGTFMADGEVVVTLPEFSQIDMIFPINATLTISAGTGDFKGIAGTIDSVGPSDFLTGVGTLLVSGEVCLSTICHIPPGDPENAQTMRVGAGAVSAHLGHGDYLGPCVSDEAAQKHISETIHAVGHGSIGCGAFAPTTLFWGFFGLGVMRLRSRHPGKSYW